ncbi:MAG: arginase family protein [Methanothrix sp.]
MLSLRHGPDQAGRALKSNYLDALDPAFAPAVGNPEPFGLTSWDVKRVIERVAPKAIGLDINELTPAYDRGETALLAARLAREFIAAKAK